MRGEPDAPGRAIPFLVLGIALLAVSNGAIFARLADAAPLAIAAWRVGLASLVVVPLALAAPGLRGSGARHCWLAAGAGALLALHFATWITSLDHTTIARSVLLVSTSPIWVALLQFLLGGGAPSRSTVLALALAIIGAAIVSGGGAGGHSGLAGDLLAVAGGIAMAGYLMLSREAQVALPFRAYLGIAYGVAAAILWVTVLATRTPAAGFDATDLVGARRHGAGLATHRPQRLQLVAAAPEPAFRIRRVCRRASARLTAGLVAAQRSSGLAHRRRGAFSPGRHRARDPRRATAGLMRRRLPR